MERLRACWRPMEGGSYASLLPVDYSRGMDIRVLGPIEVLRNGESLALGGPRQRTLLALLVARLPKSVDTDTLIDELWGEGASPERSQPSNLSYPTSARRSV